MPFHLVSPSAAPGVDADYRYIRRLLAKLRATFIFISRTLSKRVYACLMPPMTDGVSPGTRAAVELFHFR